MKVDCTAVLTNHVIDCPRRLFFQPTCHQPSTTVLIAAALHSNVSCPPKPHQMSNRQHCPTKTGLNQSIQDFIFHCKFHIRIAGFLNNMSHSFGDQSCQDAFIARLHLGDPLAPKVKLNWKTCKDDLSCSASNFLATIVQLHQTEMQPLKMFNTSTIATVSPKTNSRSSGSQNLPEKCLTCRDSIGSILSLPQHLTFSIIAFIQSKLTKMTMLPIVRLSKSISQSMPWLLTTRLIHVGPVSMVSNEDIPL